MTASAEKSKGTMRLGACGLLCGSENTRAVTSIAGVKLCAACVLRLEAITGERIEHDGTPLALGRGEMLGTAGRRERGRQKAVAP